MRVKILQSRQALQTSLSDLKLEFEQYADRVNLIKEDITQQVGWWVLISVSVIIFLLAVSFVLQAMMLSFMSQLVPFFGSMSRGEFDKTIQSRARFYEIEAVKEIGIHLQHYLKDMTDQLQQQAKHVLTSSREAQDVSAQALHRPQNNNR
jgi:methyl-accepting chemotaxis protein